MATRPWVRFLAYPAVFLSISAHAQDAIVGLTMTGEAYKGPPQFRLLADDQVIGTKIVSSAIDTRKSKLDWREGSKLPPSDRFLFKVPNIEGVSSLEIEFTNDARAKKGKQGDRNLYLLSLSVSTVKKTQTGSIVTIQEFLPSAFVAVPKESGEISTRFAALYAPGNLRIERPVGGWASTASVEETPPAKPQITTTRPKPASAPKACNIPSLELRGFDKNSATFSQPVKAQLAKLSQSLRDKSCAIRVTAYTGGGPSDTFRARLSRARAEAVVRELTKLGISRKKIQAESAPGRGRRVVISFQ